MVQSQEPTETRPRSNFSELRIGFWFSRHNQPILAPMKFFFWLAQNILVQQLNHMTTYLSSACQHHVEVTQSYAFAVLI